MLTLNAPGRRKQTESNGEVSLPIAGSFSRRQIDFFQRYPEAAALQQLVRLGWDEEGKLRFSSLRRKEGRRGRGSAGSVPAALRELPR